MTLAEHNALGDDEATGVLAGVCAAPRWVQVMVAARPHGSMDAMLAAADEALEALSVEDVDAALAGHPQIGGSVGGPGGEQSRREQSGVDAGDFELASALAAGNEAYFEKFGRIYLVCAAGRAGPELLAILQDRLGNDAATELAVTRAELGKINRLRLERLVAS